jgi:hypothetical protein
MGRQDHDHIGPELHPRKRDFGARNLSGVLVCPIFLVDADTYDRLSSAKRALSLIEAQLVTGD